MNGASPDAGEAHAFPLAEVRPAHCPPSDAFVNDLPYFALRTVLAAAAAVMVVLAVIAAVVLVGSLLHALLDPAPACQLCDNAPPRV